MPGMTQCPHCNARYTMPDHLNGKRVKCRKCGNVFTATFGSSAPTVAAPKQTGDDPFAALNELEPGATTTPPAPRAAASARGAAGNRIQPAAVGFSPQAAPGGEIALAPDAVARPGKSKPPRRKVEIDLPYANVIDGLLPLVLLVAWLGLTVWGLISTAGRDDKPVAPWAIYVMGAIAVATFLIFVVPLMTLGTAIASRLRNFFLPDFAAFRVLGTVAGFFLILMLLLGKLGAPLAAPVTRGELTGALPIAALVAAGLLALWFRVGLVNSAVLIPLAIIFAIPGIILAGMIQRAAGEPIARSAQLISVSIPGQGLRRMTKSEFTKYEQEQRDRAARQAEATNVQANNAVVANTQTRSQPDWNRVARATDSNANNLTGPRQTPYGKPVPPPPVDPDSGFAHPSPAATAGRSSPALLPVLATADTANPPLIGQFEELLAPQRPSPYVFVKRRAGQPGQRGFTIERVKAGDWKPDGSLSFESDAAADVACSPNGEFLVRKVRNGGQEMIEISSFAEGKTLHNLPLKANNPELVGFVGDKEFAVYGTESLGAKFATLWIVDAKAGNASRSFQVPGGSRRAAVGISPDGKTIAVATKTDGPPQVIFYNATGGVRKRLPLPDVGDAFFFDPRAVAFDGTGQKLAVEVAQQTSVKLYCWTEDGKLLASHGYPNFDQAVGGGGFGQRDAGQRLEWVGAGDSNVLLVGGRLLLDAQSGRFVGRVGEGDVRWHRGLGDGRLLLRQRVGAEDRFDVVTLDAGHLSEAVAAARQAGPLLFDPPPLDEKKAAWLVQGVSQKNDVPAGRLGANPDPSPASANLTDKPIALGAAHPIGHVREVFFGPGVAVVYFNAIGEGGRWDAAAGAGAELVRYDLATGKVTGRVSVPMWSEPLAISPDGELAVLASAANFGGTSRTAAAGTNATVRTQRGGGRTARTGGAVSVTPAPTVAPQRGGATAKSTSRLDLWSLGTGKYVAGWVPYAANPDESQREVRWAAMTDRDAVLTLSNTGVLIRWSVSGRKAIWGRTGISDAPAISPGNKYLVARTSPAGGAGASILVIDPAGGAAVSALALPPLSFKEAQPPAFSDDGKVLLAATNAGLLRWDVASGSVQTALTDPQTQAVDPLAGGKYALVGDRLFDLDQHAAAFTYHVAPGGQHLYGGPGGRHWYVAPSATDGQPYLCSAVIPTDAQLQAADALAKDPPLIRPGARVDLQVSAGSATAKITDLLRNRMKQNGLATDGAGVPVATLRVSAQLVNTNETIPAQVMGPGGGRTENVPLNNYHCSYDLVDAKGNVLYGSPQWHVIEGRRVGMVNLTSANQSIASRVQEELDQQVVAWAGSIYVPTYLTADGKVPPKPEAVLGVEASGG